ncbi:MAG: hypothetical protein LLG01_19910 [Planctomycetaceae bacterium]|nr:hypothetical protein [Planctomycetaceae bacterium]
MAVNLDFKELLESLNAYQVRYLLAGAHAVMHYVEPRYTKDIDIWVEPTSANAQRTWEALGSFGAPLEGVTVEDLANPDLVYQMGVAPNRIDIMMGVPGVKWETAWRNRLQTRYGGICINVMSREDLMRAKRTAGRPQDLLDLAALQQSAATTSKKRTRHSKKAK